MTQNDTTELLALLREIRQLMIWTAILSKEEAAKRIREYAKANDYLSN
jgi:hypothetical protein